MLMDHPDPVVEGVLGGTDSHRPALHQDLPLVGKVDAREHVHQGGLSAAVLSQQGKYLTAVQGQVDVVVGHHLAEALGDVPEFDCMDSFQGCHPSFSCGRSEIPSALAPGRQTCAGKFGAPIRVRAGALHKSKRGLPSQPPLGDTRIRMQSSATRCRQWSGRSRERTGSRTRGTRRQTRPPRSRA